jgi:HSP20 family protein
VRDFLWRPRTIPRQAPGSRVKSRQIAMICLAHELLIRQQTSLLTHPHEEVTMALEQPIEQKGIVHPERTAAASPFSLMRRLSDDMERIFEDTWPGHRLPRRFQGFDLATTRWTPEIEAFERKGEFVVRTDLPGMTKENIKVEVSEGDLVIQGERKEEKEQKEKGYYKCERTYGSFYRAVPLPEGVKADEAKATFKDGVLEIAMPAGKVPEKHGRQLEIK